MNRRLLARLPILACAGFIAFLFLATIWNAAVERDWPKLRIRSAQPLVGVYAGKPAQWTLDALLAGETQKAVSTNLGRTLPAFPISVRAKNQFLYSLFDVSGSSSVVVGREGQLFEPPYIREFCARGGAPDAARIDAFAEKIAAIEAALTARAKGFVYLVSPSKAARYPHYLPADAKCPAAARNSDKLAPFRAALTTRGVAHIDAAALMSEAMRDYPIDLFPRGGTHWNLLGAALATREATRHLDAASKGPPTGPYDFTWREAPMALETDRDLLDLSNLLWPDAHYPTAIVERRGDAGACARAPRLLLLGGSFLREMVVDFAQAACPPQIDYWFYFGAPDGGVNLMRRYTEAGDVSKGAERPADAALLRESLQWADAVLLEENESNISTMKQVEDLRAALAP